MTARIRIGRGPADYCAMAALVREYVAWLRARHDDDPDFVAQVLDKQSYAAELQNLASLYGPPSGAAFVAQIDEVIIGCGAYRALGDGACEMKRVFVPGRWQGSGIGRALCQALIAHARDAGYMTMKLDTVRRLTEAQRLYQSLGFRECPPYHEYPESLMASFVFMALPLDC